MTLGQQPIAFVAGATGLTGRHVVAALREAGVQTTAHVRPDSSRLEHWSRHFESLGVNLSTAAWDPQAMCDELTALRPNLVFSLLGTTKRRTKDGDGDYQTVDYGLTHCLMKAAESIDPAPLFIYLSAAGVSDSSTSAYYIARAQVERELGAGELRTLIARPSFILGDRDQARFSEDYGAPLVDGLLAVAGWVGARRWSARYRSIPGETLARGLVQLALESVESTVGVPELKAAATRFTGT